MLADKDSIVTVPFRAFLSNGTAPDTGLSNDSIRGTANGAAQFTLTNKVSAVSANAGMYVIVTTASETSVLGTLALWYDQGDFPQHIANLEVVNSNPYSQMSNIAVKTYSGVTFGSLATLVGGTYSDVTIGGVTRVNSSVTIADANYSGVTVRVAGNIALTSAVTLAAGTYSDVTIGGVTRVNSNVTIANADYSAVTVRVGGIAPGTYSGVTVGINNIAPNTYSGVTVGTAGGTFSLAPGEYSDVTVRTSVLSGHTPQTGDNFARLGAPAGASVAADIAAVKVDTAAILVDTGTTLDAAIAAVKSDTAAILVDTGTTLDAAIAAVKSDTAAILVDTGTTLDTAVAAIKVKTDQMVYTVANRLDATINSAVTLAAGTYSDVTIGGVTRVNSNVTIADADYSGVTVRASNITIATGGIVAASFGAGAIDAVALATDAGQEFADRVLLRNVASGSDGGRSVAEALYALRNRVAMDGSIGTVYATNDTSSAWTFSVTTVSTNSGLIQQVDPG